MKIDVGMYVRTERGKIWLVTSTKAIDGHKRRIVNADYNILNLIQVGDYVNGKLVSSLPLFKNEFIFEEPVNGVKCVKGIVGTPIKDNKDGFIKSIVTKEQFEQMEYKVGDYH